ncbi:SSU ribosomal protein S6p [Euzebya pacifica]|uniref:Small ribosomal subunit protein bS6 n=1 Tax=Euzebya pacifica TaxID=1608957 RepID=A0A346Y531_9ACTN|nr:30S ribosomal protein S6 [Euzebya pacifica]AXV09578.1 SSU ribosomal protein S6p [Euzebya pacifica]
MRTYELMMISRGDLDDVAVDTNIRRFTGLIGEQGGKVLNVDHWGKREFAYEINHMNSGFYTVVDLEIESDGLKELDRQLGNAEEVVRHKFVRPEVRSKKI